MRSASRSPASGAGRIAAVLAAVALAWTVAGGAKAGSCSPPSCNKVGGAYTFGVKSGFTLDGVEWKLSGSGKFTMPSEVQTGLTKSKSATGTIELERNFTGSPVVRYTLHVQSALIQPTVTHAKIVLQGILLAARVVKVEGSDSYCDDNKSKGTPLQLTLRPAKYLDTAEVASIVTSGNYCQQTAFFAKWGTPGIKVTVTVPKAGG